jgi:hypothetical protein
MFTNTVANLEAVEEPSISETVVFENISEHGARLIVGRRRPAGERVMVVDAMTDFRTAAEVVYCTPCTSGYFALGLKFR